MASETLANQSSTVTLRQKLSITIDVEIETEIENAGSLTNQQITNIINNSNANLDITSIILQVLGQYNPASLGNTDVSGTITISGDAIVNNVDSQTINTGVISVGDELIIGESSTFSLITKINDFETTITTFNSRIENMEGNIYVNDISQTFFQISTQQPNRFATSSNPAIPSTITSSSITINWNFDNILAKYDNLDLDFILNNEDNSKSSQLPYINNIVIQIKGVYDGGLNSNGQSGWLNLHTFNIGNNETYNTTNYKEFTINKTDYSTNLNINNLLTNSNNFDIRVYGLNSAVNYPSIENRALIFEQLRFEIARAPSVPIFASGLSQNPSLNTLTLTFDVSETEIDFPDSNALIDKLEIVYNLLETFRSSTYPVDALSSPDITNFTNPLYQKNTNFSGLLENLMPGSKYNFQARVQNNLNDNSFSDYSDISQTNYTLLPGSENTTINVNIDGNKEYITNNSTLNNNEAIYINIADSTHSLIHENIGIQNIEITNPNATTSGINNKGFGKLIDNSLGLVSINVYVEDISKESIIFDGDFNLNQPRHINNTGFNVFPDAYLTLNDMYFNTSSKGLRLRGSFTLNTIGNTDIISKIGSPRTTPYKLTYRYNRHSDVNGSDLEVNQYIYIDNLNIDPIINYSSTINEISNGVIDVLYNMGIPSVKTFYISFFRQFEKINSTNLFIRGDKKIASISAIGNTSANLEQILYLNNRSDINDIGTYISSSHTSMSALNNSYYNSINYNSSRLTNNLNVTWTEKVYNLFKPNGITSAISNTTLNTNHYCDYNSFNYSSGKINSPKLNLSNIHLYELTNLTALGSNINNLGFSHYTNHLIEISNNSLLYINGKFQSNKTQNYPNMSDFSYNPLNSNPLNNTITNNYNTGNINYDLNGQLTTTLNNGYKFIAFQIKKATPSQYPISYIFNNEGYNQIYFDSKYYISIKIMLSNFFDDNTLNNIFDNTNNDAIAFCKVTLINGNYTRIGNLKQEYSPIGGSWLVNSDPNISYNNSLVFNYGSKVVNSNGDIGIYIDPTAVNDDLMLIIGLKNN